MSPSIFKKHLKIVPYKYQIKGIDFGLSHNYCIIADEMGLGKSIQAIAIAAISKRERVLIVCPAFLKLNWRDELDKFLLNPNQFEVKIISYSMLHKKEELFKWADCVIFDECFDGGTEILTEKGFIRFDKLPRNIKVAQSSNQGDIDFVYPTEYIEKEYSGKMINIKSDNKIDVFCTPNHEFLVTDTKGNWVKKEAHKISSHYLTKIRLSGKSIANDNELTPIERLLIAFQADGSIHNKGRSINTQMLFSFSKKRKIDRFLFIMNLGHFKYSEVKGCKNKRRFLVRLEKKFDKKISKYFNIADTGFYKAREIIQEMFCWDGYKTQCYSNTCEDSVDFFQAIASIAGYKTKKTRIPDNRKDTYKDCFKLHFVDAEISSTQNCKKEYIDYSGRVYCVRVPNQNIVIRRGGKVCIIGNCHYLKNKDSMRTKAAHQFIEQYRPNRMLLLSGTPITGKIPDWYSLLLLCSYNPMNNSGIGVGNLSYYDFCSRFCNTHVINIRGRRVVQFYGHKNIPQLKKYLKDKYIRRLCKDVLDLSSIVESQIAITQDDLDPEGVELMDEAKKEGVWATIKKGSAISKASKAVDFINELCDNGPVVVFSDHRDPVDIISKGLIKNRRRVRVITGDTPMEDRHTIVKLFQDGRLDSVVCTIGAASTGITLTKASQIVFNDLSARADQNAQAIKRVHRIGQDQVVKAYFLTSNKIDKDMTYMLRQKVKTMKEAM